jgi:DTW domain-containing protein YfiP
VVVRHASEVPRLTNSGRWAAAAIQGSILIDHALEDARSDDRLESLLAEGPAWLLYPSASVGSPAGPRPGTIVVPDATWAQARRMVQRIAPLRALPRLALPPPPGVHRLRRPPRAGGMSTLEAIAGALEQLDDPDSARALRALHLAAVEKTLRLKGMWPPGRDHHPGETR